MPINDYEQIAADYAKGQPVGVGGPAPEPIATPVPSAPAPRPYDELLHNKNLLQEQELQQMMYLAKNRDPEQVAKAKKLSDETGLPLGFVERNYDEVHKRSNSVLPDYAKIVRDTPGLAKFLEDPDNAALSKDDLAGLAKVDMATRMFVPKPRDSYFDLPMELGRAGESGLHRLKASAFHLGAALGKVDKREAAETVAAAKLRARELQEQMPSYAKDFNKDFEVEMKDASRAWNRFTGSFDRLREGKIFQAYTDLQLGRLQLVGEAMDMLLTAAKHPRGFLYSGVEQVSNMLPSLATRLAGGAAGAAVGSAVPGIGTAVGTGVGLFSGNFVGSVGTEIGAWIDQRLEEKGYDLTNADDIERAYNDHPLMTEILGEATRKGIGTAGIDSLLSAFAGVGGAGKGASLAKKAASAGKKLALETVGEAGGEFAGQAAAYKGDVRKVNFGEVLQEGILSLGTSGVTVAGDSIRSRYSKDTIKATEQFTKDYQNAQQSINEGVALNELGQAVNEAKLTGRVPDKLAELVTEAGGDSGAVYFQTDDFDSYWNKKGLSPVKAAEQIMGDEGKAYFEAKQNGTPLEVSLGDYASKVAPTEDFSGLNEIARARPDGMTLTEAQEFMQSLPGTMQELAKEATETGKETQDSMKELSQIKRVTSQQLMALDIGFTKDQADAYATWQAQRINARAKVLGISPAEVYKQDSLELITGDKMPTDGPEGTKILNQNAVPPFYSKLEKTVQEKVGNSATVEQVQGAIKDIKAEERKWMGVDEFLKGKTKVTKEEMLTFLRGNQLQIQEVTKGGVGYAKRIDDALRSGNEQLAQDLTEERDSQPEQSPVKFDKYTLPGGKNYRELLFTLPENAPQSAEKLAEMQKERDALNKKLTQADAKLTAEGVPWDKINAEAQRQGLYTAADRARLTELALALGDMKRKVQDERGFQSSHFDEKNVLAHTRFNERVDADGKRVLFIEEIQSDWHQAGREKGYKTDIAPDAIEKSEEKFTDAVNVLNKIERDLKNKYIPETLTRKDFKKKTSRPSLSGKFVEYTGLFDNRDWQITDVKNDNGRTKHVNITYNGRYVGKEFNNGFFKSVADLEKNLRQIVFNETRISDLEDKFTPEEMTQLAEARSAERQATNEMHDAGAKSRTAVPDAPFRKTWHEFVFKRMVRYAAENGFDKIGWTTGEQQAERYSLAKSISKIELLHDKKTGNYTIYADDLEGNNVLEEVLGQDIKGAEKFVGKEVVKKLEDQEWQQRDNPEFQSKAIEGENLKIGGEGMKGFYDKILVDYANKFGKKYGAKVESLDLDNSNVEPPNDYFVTGADGEFYVNKYEDGDSNGEVAGPFTTEQEAERAKEKLDNEKDMVRGAATHALPITPELKAAALNQGFELFQEGKQGPRGSIQFLDKKTIIRLGQAKDPSTFIHELGHFWLEQMGKDFQRVTAMPERTGAQEQFLKDVAETLNYLGVKDFSEIGVEHHEKWARSVEAYAMEGKSPSSALRRVLSKFKVWLTSVYRDLRNLNVQLTPEIRKVMDRLVATEEEIAAAEREQNFEPLFADPTAFGMKGKAAEAYITAREEARTAADQKLRAMVMKDLERERSKEYEARREQVKALVTEEISQQQVYQAITQLQFGNQFDGSPMKLNKKAIVELMGSGILEQLPKPLIYTVKGGISPNEAATYFGYASGEEMLKSMVGVPKIETAIEAETNLRMAAEFPDTHTQEEFVEGAMEAIHNDQRAKVLRMELEHMASNDFTSLKRVVNKAVRRVPSEKAVKQHAAKIIGQNSVKALKPNLFLRAEAKASRDAANALTAGDFDAAFLAKRNELLNHELFRASMAAKEKVQKTREFAKKVFKADEPMAKTRDMNLVNAARSVFAAYGLGKSDKAPGDYLKLMEAYDPGAFETMQSLVDTVMEGAGPYKDVSYDKFTEMADTAKALWDLAKSHKSMEIEGQKVEQDLVKEELLERLDEVTKLPDNGGYSRLPGAKEERKSFFLGARAAGTRVEHWAQSLGPKFVKYIYKPIKDKAVQFRAERHKKFLEFDKILEPIAKTITTQDIVSDELKHIFKGNSEIIGGLLHTGNASNYRKYLIGNGWATLSEDGILDDSRYQAFIKRMAAEGKVTKEHMDAVQKIWDLFESVKAGAQEAHYKRYGFHFNEITAQPVVTPWGEYKGGYAPAIADPTRASDAAQRAEKALLEGQQNAGMFPHTDRGFTKGRIENYAAPLISDLRLVPQHIDKVLRFTHMEPVVNQVARLLWDKQFRKGLDNFDEAVVQELLVPWLHRSATQKTSTPALGSKWFKTLNRWAGVLRSGVGQNIMVLNVTNAMQNVTGLSVAAVKVKPRYLRNAMWDKLTDSAKTAEFIQNKSFFMANELSSSFHEVQQRIENVLLDPSKFEKVGQFSRENGYILQKHSQNFMNQVAWLGAYNQAVEAGMSDKDAVAAADSVVRTTQGSMTPEDISRLEASSDLAKLFLMFYGYFNNQANLLGSEYQKVVRDQGLKAGAGRALYLYFWGFMVPAVMSEVIVRAMSGKGIDEDDDDQYLDDVLNVFFGSQVRTASAFFPIVGQTAMAGINAWNDKWYDDRISTSPAVSMIESAVKSPHSVYKAIVEDGNKKTAIRDTMSLLGLVTGLPLAPLSKPLGYASDVAEGKVKSSGPIDFTRGLITGKGPKQ